MAPRVHETDICIIGSGITAALMAQKLSTTKLNITVVEAGGPTTPFAQRAKTRARWLAYGETPWPDDHINDQNATGTAYGFSPSMTVGGLAMHWGGVTPRYSPEDFHVRSLYGVGDDWPVTYDEMDPFYQEAEEIMGISGEQGPAALDPRGRPFPMPAIPLSYNLALLREWMHKAGVAMWSQPSAKNTVPYDGRGGCQRCDSCYPICPTGAKYSPDFTFDKLTAPKRITMLTHTLVRRLHADEKTGRITSASANTTDGTNEEIELRAKTFILAGGFTWSPHLLLLSAGGKWPNGLANSSGLVGKYLCGHRNVAAQIKLPLELYPGMNAQHSLVTKQFMRVPRGGDGKYLRHDLRVWESSFGRDARLRDDAGALLFGDAMLNDWRTRAKSGVARIRAYYDVLPARESELTLDSSKQNRWGDPMPRLTFRDAPESAALRSWQEATIRSRFADFAKAGGGEIISQASSSNDIGQEHPGGGCRMGSDAATSVVDKWGRTHDHENLFVAGAPTNVTASCCNGTLTFGALGLRTAAAVMETGR